MGQGPPINPAGDRSHQDLSLDNSTPLCYLQILHLQGPLSSIKQLFFKSSLLQPLLETYYTLSHRAGTAFIWGILLPYTKNIHFPGSEI